MAAAKSGLSGTDGSNQENQFGIHHWNEPRESRIEPSCGSFAMREGNPMRLLAENIRIMTEILSETR